MEDDIYLTIKTVHTLMIQPKEKILYVGVEAKHHGDFCFVFKLKQIKEIAEYYNRCIADGTNT